MPYKFLRFEKGKYPKKYNAILQHDVPGRRYTKKVPFGDQRYEHYEDKTPLKLYVHLNHKDPERRKRYYQRHGTKAEKYTAKWFSHRYLW